MLDSMYEFFKSFNKYRFKNSWIIEADSRAVWEEIINYKEWPEWCYGVKEVESVSEDSALVAKGNVFRSVWKGALPYTLVFEATIQYLIPYTFISFKIAGDLEGVGVCRLASKDGVTHVNFLWNVSPSKWWMVLLAPIAKPLFKHNHDRIVDNGLKGLKSVLFEKNFAV